MENLRLILLTIGCLFILGIYLREVFLNSKTHQNKEMLEAVDELPDLPEINEIATVEKQREPLTGFEQEAESIANLGNFLSRARNDSPEDSVLPDKISARAAEADAAGDNIDLMNISAAKEVALDDEPATDEFDESVDLFSAVEGDGDEETDSVSANQPAEKSLEQGSKEKAPEILILYIVSASTDFFNGDLINEAVLKVGMDYGDMNIFHHFGTDLLRAKQPLLSMANMYEPGTFDLAQMANLKTKGLALFMYAPPKTMAAESIFDLFLNTARQIAVLLDGELRTATHEPLNDAAINSLRDQAQSLASMGS